MLSRRRCRFSLRAALRRFGCAQAGNTPLHYAAKSENVACVTLLLEYGANMEERKVVRCAAPLPPPLLRNAADRPLLRSDRGASAREA
jgi:ankyrin repeat protein